MAYVNLGQVIYPIGAIFASTSSTSPSSMFGGTWSQITGDACLMAGTTIGNAGSKKITIAQMPSHNHPLIDVLGCGWDPSPSENDRLNYGRYKSSRPISNFGNSSSQGGGKTTCLTPTDVTCGDVLHRGDASCVTFKTSKSELVQALKQFAHSQLDVSINPQTQLVQLASMVDNGQLSLMVDSCDLKGLGIVLAERMNINSLLQKCQAIATQQISQLILLINLVELDLRPDIKRMTLMLPISIIQVTTPHTTMFLHTEHAIVGIELPNILGGVLC